MISNRPSCQRPAGFTLLELLVVVAILGLVAGLVFPAIEGASKRQAFRTVASKVDFAVRQARADALRLNRTMTVPALAQPRLGLERDMMIQDMRIEQPQNLRFYRDGTSNGGTIQLSSGPRSFRVAIAAQTGIVTSGWQ